MHPGLYGLYSRASKGYSPKSEGLISYMAHAIVLYKPMGQAQAHALALLVEHISRPARSTYALLAIANASCTNSEIYC